MKFWKRIYLSEASVAIMQDMFWWIFLDKFEVSSILLLVIEYCSNFNRSINMPLMHAFSAELFCGGVQLFNYFSISRFYIVLG